MANYAAALRDLENPVSEDYRPYPTSDMQVSFLQTNKRFLETRIQIWNDRYNVGNSKEKANIEKIVSELNKKVAAYNVAIETKTGTVSNDLDTLHGVADLIGGLGVDKSSTSTTPAASKKKVWITVIAAVLIGAAGFITYRKFKK